MDTIETMTYERNVPLANAQVLLRNFIPIFPILDRKCA